MPGNPKSSTADKSLLVGKTTLENDRLGPVRDASWELAHGHPNPYTPTSPMLSIPQSGCKVCVCVKER